MTSLMSASIRPRTRQMLNALLLAFVTGAALFWFWAYLEGSNIDANRPQLFSDATRYLAAGERLNAGHDLYALGPGDRPVMTIPGVQEAPILSPPPIAAIWRLIAAVPFGFATWMIAAWAATFTTVVIVVLRNPLPGAPLAFALSLPIGEAIFGGNTVGLYPLFYLLAWRYRDHAWIGFLIAIMAADKLAPIAMASWLLGTGRYRAMAVTAAGLLIAFVIGGAGAGFDSYFEWLSVLGTIGISPLGVSGLTGIPWASYVVFGVGVVLAVVIGRRSQSGSFIVALLAAVLGNPALYPGHFAPLLALVAPLADRRREPGDIEPVATPTVPGGAAMEA